MTTLLTPISILLLAFSAASAADTSEPSPNAPDYLRAIRANDLSALKKLCRAGCGSIHDGLDWTPLHYAALYGNTESVRIAQDGGGDANARNSAQATPLILAAYSLEKTRLLVEKGGNVNAKTSAGFTPLWVALSTVENEDTVRFLIAKGADLKHVAPNGQDYLMRAASLQPAEIVRLLLDKGLDPHKDDGSGFNALANTFDRDAAPNRGY